MLTQRISMSAVRGYSSLSIMFLSNVSDMSVCACGSIHVVTNVARFEPRVAVEHQLVVDHLVRGVGSHPALRQLVRRGARRPRPPGRRSGRSRTVLGFSRVSSARVRTLRCRAMVLLQEVRGQDGIRGSGALREEQEGADQEAERADERTEVDELDVAGLAALGDDVGRDRGDTERDRAERGSAARSTTTRSTDARRTSGAHLRPGEGARDEEADRTERVRPPDEAVGLRRVQAGEQRREGADVEEQRCRRAAPRSTTSRCGRGSQVKQPDPLARRRRYRRPGSR